MEEVQRNYVFTMPDRLPMIRDISDDAGLWVRAYDHEGMEVEVLIKGLTPQLIKKWLKREACSTGETESWVFNEHSNDSGAWCPFSGQPAQAGRVQCPQFCEASVSVRGKS